MLNFDLSWIDQVVGDEDRKNLLLYVSEPFREYIEEEILEAEVAKFVNLEKYSANMVERYKFTEISIKTLIKDVKSKYTIDDRQNVLKEFNQEFYEYIQEKIELRLLDSENKYSREELEAEYAVWILNGLLNHFKPLAKRNQAFLSKLFDLVKNCSFEDRVELVKAVKALAN